MQICDGVVLARPDEPTTTTDTAEERDPTEIVDEQIAAINRSREAMGVMSPLVHEAPAGGVDLRKAAFSATWFGPALRIPGGGIGC